MRLDTKILIIATFTFLIVYYSFGGLLKVDYSNRFFLFLLPLIWPGLAHGSLDIIIAKKLNIINSKKQELLFILSYISIALFIIFLWIVLPNLSLLFFLLVSAVHFGISDTLSRKKFFFAEMIFRGFLPISTPIYFYNQETKFIFLKLNSTEFFIDYLIKFNNYLFFSLMLLAMISLFYILLNSKTKKNFFTLVEILIIFFIFFHFDPFSAFCIYFCFFHSLRHLFIEKESLNLSPKGIFGATIPLTVISLIGLIFFYFFFLKLNQNYLSLIFISLSALTVPHMLLINKYRIPNN